MLWAVRKINFERVRYNEIWIEVVCCLLELEFSRQWENNEENTHVIGEVWNIPIYAMTVYRWQVFVLWEKHASAKFL